MTHQLFDLEILEFHKYGILYFQTSGILEILVFWKLPTFIFGNHLVEVWYSLEQYIGLKEDKLSSTTVDFIRSEGNLETKRLYWFSKPKMC